MRIDDLHKRCPKCGQVKALADFSRSSHNPQGVQSYCRLCFAQYDRTQHAIRDAKKCAAEHATEREARRAAEDLRLARELKNTDPF